MDEEKKATKEAEDKPTSEDSGEGDKYETTPIIERAREERERMEAATKAQKEENDRTEKIMAMKQLGGVAEAGGETAKKEETPAEYATRISEGNYDSP